MSEREIRVQTAVILRKAAVYIRTYGWQEEGMGQHGQPRCSMGALDSALPRGSWSARVAILMYHSLNRELHGLSLTQFNHRMQNGEAVARLYERTANKLAQPGHLQSVR